MHTAIQTRELITVTVDGVRLRGTFHRAKERTAESRPGLSEDRIGVLFLNSGFMPRASAGDAAVRWADSFAKRGYPSFRFDLPGLGDSDGDTPRKRLDFAHFVNTGHYAPFVSTTAGNLVERCKLSGIVLLGHCAGAVSAMYAAAASKHVKGIIALDPYFFWDPPERAQVRNQISGWVTRNKLGGELSKVYRAMKKLGLLLKRDGLPANANVPLIHCWSHLASAGLPMLIVNAGGPAQRAGEFDYLGYLRKLSGPGSRLDVQYIEGADHSFADDVGRAAVRRHVEHWLNARFPLFERGHMAALSLQKGA